MEKEYELKITLNYKLPIREKEADYEILDRKYPFKEWKTECLGTKPQADKAEHFEEINQNVVIRSNGQKRYFSTLMRVLSIFDREDLNVVYQLMNEDEVLEFNNRIGISKAQDEGQAGPDPGKLDEGQAGPNPDDVAESQPLPTPSVLAGPNLEHSDVEITDPSSQPQPEHMDEGFIATAYPEVQENLKLTVDEQMILEEPVSSTGTLSSLQHLTKDFSYGDQFIDDKPSEANYEKMTADTEAESMVSVTIQQDTSVIPLMTSPVIAYRESSGRKSSSGSTAMDLPKMIREQTVEFIDSQEIDRKINESVKEVVISSVKHAMRAPLRARFKDLPTSDMKESLLQSMLEENYDKGHADHRAAYEALQDSIRCDECEDFDVDKAQEETKKKSKQDSPKTLPGSPPSPPPPPPPPSGALGASGTTRASDSAQAPPPTPPSLSTY
ncbi:hypothetical protein Tco_1140408 [Tanacetum coccineum]